MSAKFEQLVAYVLNKDHETASELLHEIIVEMSKDIYENIIAEEADDEEMDESMEDDEEMDESMGDEELEDAYEMEADDETAADAFGGDASDDSLDDIEAGDEEGDEEDHESDEDQAIFDIKNAIEELEAAFAELEAAQDSEKSDMDSDDGMDMDMDSDDDEMDSDDDEADEMMGMPMENRRMTREYVEKVGNDWDKNSQKTQGAIAGANTGEKMPTANDHQSPVASAKNKPMPNVNSKNIAQGGTGEGNNTGTKPNSVNKGITPEKSGNYTGNDWAANSAPGAHAKGYTQKADRMPMKQAPEGQPAGAGTGENSVSGATNTSSIVAEGRSRRTTSKRK